jgi:SAM-dependent methyltransferase
MHIENVIDTQNFRTYSSERSARTYAGDRCLPAEVAIFARYYASHKQARILDLACGTGRLANVLANTGRLYIGADYSPTMVAWFRRLHPQLTITLADLRTFPSVIENCFDVIWLSFNGIDSISYDERDLVYQNVASRLIPGGYFIFSTHNLGFLGTVNRRLKFPDCSFYCRAKSALRQYFNRIRLNRHTMSDADFAVVNDRSQEFGLLNVYVNPDRELARLESAGLKILEILDAQGGSVPLGTTLSQLPSAWFHFVTTRCAE